jgi:hypothetical protein
MAKVSTSRWAITVWESYTQLFLSTTVSMLIYKLVLNNN